MYPVPKCLVWVSFPPLQSHCAKLKRYVALLFALLLFLTLPAHAQQTITGEVVAVKDGDTIEVLHGRQAVNVRLHGIDTPERGQPFGTRAKQRVSDLVFWKVVRVEVTDTDRYGRTVGRVHIAGGVLNEMLVREGLAWWYRQYAPRDGELERLEQAALRAAGPVVATGSHCALGLEKGRAWRGGRASGASRAALRPGRARSQLLGLRDAARGATLLRGGRTG